jgi:hypothetical protein
MFLENYVLVDAIKFNNLKVRFIHYNGINSRIAKVTQSNT